MKTTLIRVLLTCAFLLPFRSAAEPAELTAARLAYETKLAGSRGRLDAALLTRGKQYATVIKAQEDRATLSGNLNLVVLLKAEREAYEQGKRTNGFGPNMAKVPPEARDARRTLEADIAQLRAKGEPEGQRLAGEYVQALEGLERKLTMKRDVTGALEVKKERSAVQQVGMAPLASDAAQSSSVRWRLLNTKWKWWGAETLTFHADGKATWSGGGEPWPWKVDNVERRVISAGNMPQKRTFTITFDSDFKTGVIRGDDAQRTTQIMAK
jgi:hypothetical protein